MKKIGFIIIGDEILCGKTRDINLQNLALLMGEKGYQIGEVRVIPDNEEAIIKTVNEMRKQYFLVITSGGIGATHDDITSESVAKAFNVELEINKDAKNILEAYYKEKNLPFNEARMKMAKMPKGAELILNSKTAAPGFKIQNVYVLAGIPVIFQSMLEEIIKTLEDGVKLYFTSIDTKTVTEGMIATELGAIQKEYQGKVFIGSYPKIENGGHLLEITFRSIEKAIAEECKAKVLALLSKH